MNEEEFQILYGNLSQKTRVIVNCNCGKSRTIVKEKAIVNMNNNNGEYVCRSCSKKQEHLTSPMTKETKDKISKAKSGIPMSEEAKKKLSDARKLFFTTPEGIKERAVMSARTAMQHGKMNMDKYKKPVFYISNKNNGCIVICGSSGEFVACEDFFEKDDSIVSYESQIYYNINGRHRSLDFLITYKDGTKKAIEVKPEKRMKEEENRLQIQDSSENAKANNYSFELWTEKELNIKDWHHATLRADMYRKEHYGIDFISYRKNKRSERAKRYYDKHIGSNKVEFHCEYCNEKHSVLKISYENNINIHGRYICLPEMGARVGKLPKKIKENPYATEGKKECITCKQVLEFSKFTKDKSRRDRYKEICKDCNSKKRNAAYKRKKLFGVNDIGFIIPEVTKEIDAEIINDLREYQRKKNDNQSI